MGYGDRNMRMRRFPKISLLLVSKGRICLERPRWMERRLSSQSPASRKEVCADYVGMISLLLDLAVYYLRLFRAVVAGVAECWLVNGGICTGGLSEDGCDVQPQGGKPTSVMGLGVTCMSSHSIELLFILNNNEDEVNSEYIIRWLVRAVHMVHYGDAISLTPP